MGSRCKQGYYKLSYFYSLIYIIIIKIVTIMTRLLEFYIKFTQNALFNQDHFLTYC